MRRLLDRTIEKLYILPEDIALARISDRMADHRAPSGG
jgi:hypothetical protein